ncbi:hypothetical protein MKK75_03210 [Methylobacterium sp. J-030]|uniref:DUF6197 family protein n=1 Tax=Methylobacterium sp. J-030 TaxID=2836627 RepID=UPI001FB8AF0F|nr:hypothetical protein [Methylobacterium sp. J-030]MCJ2067825.1 hypothetical protein [Methylobacterium sp. J-030]
MTTAGGYLRAARDTLTDPAHWTKEAYARDRRGAAVASNSPEAVCWCAYGALERLGTGEIVDAREYLRVAADDLFKSPPAGVNDHIGHAAVLRMYDRAIELAEAQS